MTVENRYLKTLGSAHNTMVLARRKVALARAIADCVDEAADSLLDVGCGDGGVGRMVGEARPKLRIEGVEVLQRPDCKIPCTIYDGKTLPFPDGSFDLVQAIDVLHHTEDINGLLGEMARVARRGVIIKDHLEENKLDHAVLRFMDWVGNRAHGVGMTYNYQPKAAWRELIGRNGLTVSKWQQDLGLYPKPFKLVFERNLHFVALLSKNGA
jgi:ubiquinone/menaquinone biosynthesis C-methylase UbiE